MRVLYVIPRYWPSVGGAQLLSRELVRRMSLRHEVLVVTQFTSDQDSFATSLATATNSEYRDGEIQIIRVGPEGLWRPILQMMGGIYSQIRVIRPIFALLLERAVRPRLMQIMCDFHPDLLHAVHVGLVYSSEIAYRAARSFGVPFVWTPFPHIEGGGWRGPRFRYLYRHADAIVAMTQREKRWLIEHGAPADHVHVIPVGPIVYPEYDAQAFRAAYGLGDAPVVLFLAQKLPYKGYRQVVEAAYLIWRQIPEVRFLFVGPRTMESERYFASVKDPRIIELPAIVDPFEKSSLLAASDVLCVPSVQESLGAVYLEAWSFKKPVIAANIEIAREVVSEGEDGFLVEQEAAAIAAALLKLLQDKELRTRMGEAGYRKVQQYYNWDRIVDQIEDVYRNLIRRDPVGSGGGRLD